MKPINLYKSDGNGHYVIKQFDNDKADELLAHQVFFPEQVAEFLVDYRTRYEYKSFKDIVENLTDEESSEYKTLADKFTTLYTKAHAYATNKGIFSLQGDLEHAFMTDICGFAQLNCELIQHNKKSFDISEMFNAYAETKNLDEYNKKVKLSYIYRTMHKIFESIYDLDLNNDTEKETVENIQQYFQELNNKVLKNEEKIEK